MDWAVIQSDRLRPATNPLARALAISLAAHLLFFGVLQVTIALKLQWPRWLKLMVTPPAGIVQLNKPRPNSAREVPLLFVEVDPSQATAEAPKDTKNYSQFNSIAANPDVSIDSEKAKMEGKQTHAPKVVDTLRPTPLPPPPTQEKTEPPPKPEEPKPAPAPKPGDLALVKPADNPPKETPKPPRPRTLVEAQLQKGIIPGQKKKQEGGVQRHGTVASFDAKGTAFGAYDAAIIAAVSKRWYDILDATTTPTRPGKVVLEFRLHSDGRITDLKVLDSEVGDMLSVYCQSAIKDPAPYAPWPDDMRRMINRDYRQITFSFYYEY